jgi:hypothetical protein
MEGGLGRVAQERALHSCAWGGGLEEGASGKGARGVFGEGGSRSGTQ